MNKFLTLTFSAIFLMHTFSYSQNVGFDFLDINNVKARINANGNHFWDMDTTSFFEVPKNSGKSSIHNFALWFIGKDVNNQIFASAETYCKNGHHDFAPGPIANIYNAMYDQKWNKVWKINRSTIDSFLLAQTGGIPNYSIPSNILFWPAHGDTSNGESFYLAPFVDINSDGLYNPNQGDYPKIKGDQAIWFVYNDERNLHTESNSTGFKLEIQCMAYSFECLNDTALNNAIFLNYKGFIRSTLNYHDIFTGFFTDFDLGDKYDNYTGCDVKRGLYYCYNADSTDGNGFGKTYGAHPSAVGVLVLAGSLLNPDGLDNPKAYLDPNGIFHNCSEAINGLNFGDAIPDNERYGLRRFVSLNYSDSSIIDFANSGNQFFNLLNNNWFDGSPVVFGGNGHCGSGLDTVNCDFMYPGETDPCNWGTGGLITVDTNWTEESANNLKGDRIGIGSFGPISNDIYNPIEFDLAIIWSRDYHNTNQQSVEKLKYCADTLINRYRRNALNCSGVSIGITEFSKKSNEKFRIVPNPAQNIITIIGENLNYPYSWELYNLLGEKVCQGKVEDQMQNINISNLKQGTYIIKIQDSNSNLSRKFIKL